MPARRTIIAIAGGIVAVGLVGFGVAAALDDPDDQVTAINLTDTRSQPAPSDGLALDDPDDQVAAGGLADTRSQPAPGDGASRQVPALEELAGVVERDGDDADDLEVGRVDLDFGPDSWVATAGATEDFDGDGTAEALRAELDGLVGNDTRFQVRFDTDGDDADVYAINDLVYREITGPAPWQSADAVGEDEIRRAAAAAVGEGARVVDLEPEDGTAVAWEAEVVDNQGREHDVLLDAAGNVIDVRQD